MPVAGEGPQPCFGMIVGEAPGREEDREGRPFVGRSGRLLDTALRAIGIERSEVYVTNVVKDLPLDAEDKIRRPTEEEIAAWLPILAGEIEKTAPAVILALGRTSTNALLSRLHGVTGNIPFGSVVGNIVVAWHPAFVLRNSADFENWLRQLDPFEVMLTQAAWEKK